MEREFWRCDRLLCTFCFFLNRRARAVEEDGETFYKTETGHAHKTGGRLVSSGAVQEADHEQPLSDAAFTPTP